MASVVTRKIPEIVLVDKEQLGVKELFKSGRDGRAYMGQYRL